MPGQLQISDRRVPELDGLRGAASIMVVVSHYFGELPHGIAATMFGWIGVNIFFVLSGYLIGKLILEKKDCANFFEVFYVRRFLRIVPVYMVTLVIVLILLSFVPHTWANNERPLPTWTYFAFLQVFPMAATGSIGAHWIAPTWTLAVEEHFYLVVPALLVFTPRRYLVHVLLAGAGIALCLRIAVFHYGLLPPLSGLVFLPFRADTLICGLLAGLAIHSGAIPWDRYMVWIRVTPIVALILTFLSRLLGGPTLLQICSPLFMGIGCAAFILSLVLGAPEARRFQPRLLQRIGDNSYCLYLSHLAVLGLMHGLILHALPDVHTPAQWAVTVASLPVAALVAFLMTRYIEEPLTRYGRSWKWSRELRSTKTLAGPQLPQVG
ncbi:MAG TPA: acyltransferase [Rhizomicrobium sp.]|nr:acyltransferase [Rhizomicrobium sp.]